MTLLSQSSSTKSRTNTYNKPKAKKYKRHLVFMNYKEMCDSYHENFVSIASSAFSCILDDSEIQSINCENRVHLDFEFYLYLKSFWNYK